MKRLFAHLRLENEDRLVSALWEEGKVWELSVLEEEPPLVGRVYVGVVEEIVPGIQAAFVRLGEGLKAYLPLQEADRLIYADGRTLGDGRKNRVCRPGDTVIVQVVREALKGKLPAVSSKIELVSRYFVISTALGKVGVSKKLSGEEREEVLNAFSQVLEKVNPAVSAGFTLRTNAGQVTQEILELDFRYLYEAYERVVVRGRTRTAGSLLYEPPGRALRIVMDDRRDLVEEIVVEEEVDEKESVGQKENVRQVESERQNENIRQRENGENVRQRENGEERQGGERGIYESLLEYLKKADPGQEGILRRYEDNSYPLSALYGLRDAFEKALAKKVWLKSGGFLVIEQTEAFWTIDVNTGKFVGKKDKETSFRKINLEAAGEVARQLRIRNLSGIILVDFINMAREENRLELLETLRRLVKKDPLGTEVVDMTPLGIVELTRKKERKSLTEQLKWKRE